MFTCVFDKMILILDGYYFIYNLPGDLASQRRAAVFGPSPPKKASCEVAHTVPDKNRTHAVVAPTFRKMSTNTKTTNAEK